MLVTKASTRPRFSTSPSVADMPLLESLSRPTRLTGQAPRGQGDAPAVVGRVELWGAVVVRQEQIGPAVAVEAPRGDGERPARASHAHPIGHVLEPPIPEVMKRS